ncbi:MAG: aquaporin [Deltaproteobacteria bacterium]|nr:aquaporin [Deltaproteobacteria bacterium]
MADTGLDPAARLHWPEYLIEGALLGALMITIGGLVTLFEYPGSAVHAALDSAALRRAFIGAGVGLAVTLLAYSPWGKRSGAHMNPAVTLAFLGLRKISRVDAAFYVAAQFAGGTLGVALAAAIFGAAFTEAPVEFAVTIPGEAGPWVAFLAELVLSAGLMITILAMTSSNVASLTGFVVGALIAVYIALEAPLSGMSINPARTFASAAPLGSFGHLWIYFVAPTLGAVGGALVYVAMGRRAYCAKLIHESEESCIHCAWKKRARAEGR